MSENVKGEAQDIKISFAANATTNTADVLFEVLLAGGDAVDEPYLLDVWLSDASDGLAVTGTETSSAAAIVSGYGTVFDIITAKKFWHIQTNSDGQAKLSLLDTARTCFYATVRDPRTGRTLVSAIMVDGNYGA